METEVIAQEGTQDIIIKRSFNAQKDKVFKLFVDKDLQFEWQSAFLQDFDFIEFDGTSGGSFWTSHSGIDGLKYGFKGVFHEIIDSEQIIRTSEFLGLPFKVIPVLEVYSFKEVESTTQLIIQIICDSAQTRNQMVQHGMKQHFDAIFGKMDSQLI